MTVARSLRQRPGGQGNGARRLRQRRGVRVYATRQKVRARVEAEIFPPQAAWRQISAPRLTIKLELNVFQARFYTWKLRSP